MKELFLFVVSFLFAFSLRANGDIDSYNQKRTQEEVRLIFSDGELYVEGGVGVGTISIYTIIGNPVAEFSNVELSNFREYIPLESKSMYIMKIQTPESIDTYKFISE